MANTVIAFPQYGFSGGQTVPILAVDNGDGTYSLGTVAYNQSYKSPVRVATTGAGTLATSFANGQTVDGIVIATGDRILIKNQVAAATNGIYIVAASGAPTRATDFDQWAEIPGAVVGVLVGTTNADTAWICTSDSGGTIGVTAINFSAFGSPTDLHSPGPIGDVTPSTVNTKAPDSSTSPLTAAQSDGTVIFSWSPNNYLLTNGVWRVQGTNGTTTLGAGADIRADSFAAFTLTNASFNKNGGGKFYWTATDKVAARNAADDGFVFLQGKLTTDTNATTGLIAGALAALTNASIVIYDAAGTAYRVPCVTP